MASIQCLETVAKHAQLMHHEDVTAQQPFDVTAWISYLDSADELVRDCQGDDVDVEVDVDNHTSNNVVHGNTGNGNGKRQALLAARDWIGRRALQLLPRSYKLWKNHWEFACQNSSSSSSSNSSSNGSSSDAVVQCFERAVLTLSAYPRVWMEYLIYLQAHPGCCSVTALRRTVNRALQAVAVTQHGKLWSVLVPFLIRTRETGAAADDTADAPAPADDHDHDTADDTPVWNIPMETRIQLLERHVTIDPTFRSQLADFLMAHQKPAAAAACLYQLLLKDPSETNNTNNTTANTATDAANTDHWQAFTALCSQHSVAVERAGVPWETILRASLTEDSQQQGQQLQGLVWTQLADAWIRRGAFDTARTVYEEGLGQVHHVRDFSVVYDAYLQFEEGLLQAAVANLEDADLQDDNDNAGNDDDDNDDNNDWDILLGTTATSKLADMELTVARAEHLTARRPLMLNQVLLRQNPHNVGEWLQRAELYVQAAQPGQAAASLEEALKIVHAVRAVNGTPCQLVTRLVTIYEDSLTDVVAARDLLDRMCHQVTYPFKKPEDLAECWAAWVELELRQEAYDDSLSLARQSVAAATPDSRQYQLRLNLQKSLRLWDLLLDLEESLGTVQTTKDAYNRALESKAATVQHVLNYATFLVEQKYFEESFSAYERGLELFAFPHVGAKLLWKAYLKTFTDRYKGSKVERTRELYQRCLDTCPAEESADFFMTNGDFEEEYGLTKRALSVYGAMCQKVPALEKLVAYQLFIAKTTKYLGLTATRDIYQEAIQSLEDPAAANMSLDFAKMETSLQQIDRARAILAYGAQLADPRRLPDYWKLWNEFEIAHGNEETFREMLRVKRSVEAAFSTVNYNATGMTDKVENLSNEEAMKMIASREGVDVDQRKTAVSGFVSGKRTAAAASLDDVEQRVAKLRKATGAVEATEDAKEGGDDAEIDIDEDEDDDEIDIDDIDAEIEKAAAEGAAAAVQDVSTKSIPAAVFGGLAAQVDSQAGALERLRAAK